MPISPSGAQVWRDFVTDGVPVSGAYKPAKSAVRAWSQSVETFIEAIASAAAVFDTRANLFASLSYAANTLAWVVADSTAAYNGIYRKSGASGSGSWARVADLPYSFIVASDVGAGTPNAIQATSSIPISESALVLLNVFEANTGSPVTVAFNGGMALTIKANGGGDVATGGLTAGMLLLGRVSGSTFRISSDQASAALQSAAEAAADLAESWAEGTLPGGVGTKSAKEWALVAQGAVTYNRAAARGTTTGAGPYDVGVTIGSVNNVDVKIGGVIQDHDKYTISGTTFTLTTNPGSGLPWEAVVQTEVRQLGAPSDGTVGTAAIADDAVTLAKLNADVTDYLDDTYAPIGGGGDRGSITPSIEGSSVAGTATYSVRKGAWHRFNGRIHWDIEATWTGHSGSGDMQVTGIPLPSAQINTPVYIHAADITYSGQLQAVQLAGTGSILIASRSTGAGASAVALDTAGTLRLSGSFPSDDRMNILFLGDSVTFGVRAGVTERDTFRSKIHAALKWAMSHNGGVGGENASEIEARTAAALTASAPQAVCVMTGINDYFDPLAAATMKSKLQSIIDLAEAAGAKVTLCSPSATNDAGMLAGFGPWLTAIQELATENPSIVYVPVYEAFINYKTTNGDTAFASLFVDTQHIGPTGHDLVVATMLATPGACLPA